jgi:glutamate N-acetyltransferase/amino-acid N-acetyltransferase
MRNQFGNGRRARRGEGHLLSPEGFRAGVASAGIRTTRGRPDVGLLVCRVPASAAAMFTTNKVVAAPVRVGWENLTLSRGILRAVVVNAGNANACTGSRGIGDAHRMCRLAASQIGCAANQVLPCSTGIIGHHLPMDRVQRGIVEAAQNLGDSSAHAAGFADAILTTDTRRKTAAATVKLGRGSATIAGVCKGSGMIGPRLAVPHATMLACLTTDAQVSPAVLRRLLGPAVDRSFNAVTVDDHTSTNDTVAILASGLSGAKVNTSQRANAFLAALTEVCESLAYQIAADGEGATKVIRVIVRSARNAQDAARIARAIANSPLVKCAMNGNDPNWGRIVSAAGMCGAAFDPDRAVLTVQDQALFRRGRPVAFDNAKASRALASTDVNVTLACHLGDAEATVLTCDLSKDYVTINADYHT